MSVFILIHLHFFFKLTINKKFNVNIQLIYPSEAGSVHRCQAEVNMMEFKSTVI